jgi:hypothetical protein
MGHQLGLEEGSTADIVAGLRVAALLAVAGCLVSGRRLPIGRLIGAGLAGVGIGIALGSVVVRVGLVGSAADMAFDVGAILADMRLDISLSPCRSCKGCYQNSSDYLHFLVSMDTHGPRGCGLFDGLYFFNSKAIGKIKNTREPV